MKIKRILKSNRFIFSTYTRLLNEKFLFKVWLCKFNKFYRSSSKKIANYKNLNESRRCFIIGNGPSLRAGDLDKLKNEYTFGTNMIYKIFSETKWRPTYYVAQDYVALEHLYKDSLNNLRSSKIFLPTDVRNININYSKDINYFYLNRRNPFPRCPKFSSDVSKVIYEGGSVTYSAIQLAAYMGFKEIYLLGMDHSYKRVINTRGEITEDNCVKDYFSVNYNQNQSNTPANLELPSLAYNSAKQYCDKNKINIYNATRGGKLEIYDRVNFDELQF